VKKQQAIFLLTIHSTNPGVNPDFQSDSGSEDGATTAKNSRELPLDAHLFDANTGPMR